VTFENGMSPRACQTENLATSQRSERIFGKQKLEGTSTDAPVAQVPVCASSLFDQ
jgi:hypothetical protein